LPLNDVGVRVVRRAREYVGVWRREPGAQAGHRRDGSCPRRGAWHGLNEVPARVQSIAFIAAEEERTVFRERPAEGAAELIQPEGDLGTVGALPAAAMMLSSALRWESKW